MKIVTFFKDYNLEILTFLKTGIWKSDWGVYSISNRPIKMYMRVKDEFLNTFSMFLDIWIVFIPWLGPRIQEKTPNKWTFESKLFYLGTNFLDERYRYLSKITSGFLTFQTLSILSKFSDLFNFINCTTVLHFLHSHIFSNYSNFLN